MPTYQITAPDGHTYRIDGPPGASDAQVRAAVLAQHPEAGNPPPHTGMQELGLGTRDVMEDAGGVLDWLAGPANIVTNKVFGTHLSTTPFHDLAASAADKMGLVHAQTPQEQVNSAIIQGGTQGLASAGLGMAAGALPGAVGAMGRIMGASPLLQTTSGAASGAAQGLAAQAGAGTTGQFIAGLAGGMVPIGVAGAIRSLTTPRTLPEVVADTPRAAMIDETGELTPHGREMAAQTGATPEEVVQAYDAPAEAAATVANEQTTPAVAREATSGAPDTSTPETPPEAATAPPQTQPIPEAIPAPETPEMPPEPVETPLHRVQAGQKFGIDYTRGQATRNFDIQDREQQLAKSNGLQAEAMRQFNANQIEQVKAAVQQFKRAFADPDMPADQRGAQVQQAIRNLRDQGEKGVSALYRQAKDLGQAVPLDTDGVKQVYQRLMVEANVPDAVKNELTQEMARYGIIGSVDERGPNLTSEAGVTHYVLDDGAKGKFYGEPQTLGLDNAEDLRKVVNSLYRTDGPRKLTQLLKPAIDDAVEQAAQDAASGESGAAVPEALKNARAAHVAQKQTFESKDVVQALADWKKGAEGVTPQLDPAETMRRTLATTDSLKRVKAVLLGKPTAESRAAWRTIQAHGLAVIFDKATTQTANVGGEITDAISGAKLRSAIASFGVDKLKVLLDPDQFNTLMQLRRTIEDVTVPISGTVNTSNSGNLIMRLVKNAEYRAAVVGAAIGEAVAGPVGAVAGGAVAKVVTKAVKESAATRAAQATLAGTHYTPEMAAAETATAGAAPARPSLPARAAATGGDAVRAFIETYKDPAVLTPVLVAAQPKGKRK